MKHQQTAPQPPGPARMVIADDHELARAGLRSMLEGDRGVVVVGEATNGAEAVELCQQLKPDLALLDVRMPDMDGLAATRVIRQVSPETRIVIVTTHENPEYLLVALKAGAAGYLLKLVVEGQTNRQIAERLSLSIGTVKIHVEHIIAKLGVSDRTQAAVHAVEWKLLQPTMEDQ